MHQPKQVLTRLLILFALVGGILGESQTASSQGFVVNSWASPTYGFTIDYRTDAFRFISESSSEGVDRLELQSDVGLFRVAAFPVVATVDECAQAIADEVYATTGNHELQEPIANGTAIVRSTNVDQNNVYTDNVTRVDCLIATDSSYMVRFIHEAITSEYGRYEVAARDIRASYRPGFPANNPLPPNVTDPDGTLEVSVMPLRQVFPPPGDLNTLYQPTILLTVEFLFDNPFSVDALLETDRIIISGFGPSISHVWYSGDVIFTESDIVVSAGTGIVGHLVFAIPADLTNVTFCYQHVTDVNCTELFTYEVDGVYGGGPGTRPRINPGR